MTEPPAGLLPRWSPIELRTLAHLVDTFVGNEAVGDRSGGLNNPPAPEVARDVAAAVDRLPRSLQADMHRLLRAIESRWMNLLLGEEPTPFSKQDPDVRERFLSHWARSRLRVKRRGFHALKRLILFLYYTAPTPDGRTVSSELPGYRLDTDSPSGKAVTESALPELTPETSSRYSVDVAVIGSGAGGAVIASTLARAGFSVLVLEGGDQFPTGAFPHEERTAYDRMFSGHGLLTTEDSAINLLAGATAGGSTTVNWMTCLRPPPEVRSEWRDAGIPGVAATEFDRTCETIEQRLGVGLEESQRNGPNELLFRGCQALDYREGIDFETIRRNARGCAQRCGPCVFGCNFGAKQSVLNTFLSDAAQGGARFLFRTRAERLVVQGDRAMGVEASYRGRNGNIAIDVRARVFVVAGGAIETPALLLRSGLRSPGIGSGLHLHPTTAVVGEYDHPVRMWEGPMQTVVVRKFQSTDPPLHGPWIESTPAHPGLSAQAFPWRSAREHRESMRALERAAATIVLVRDVGEGRVGVDAEGASRVAYRLGRRDQRNLLRGMTEAARIHRAAGALRISTLHYGGLAVGDGARPVSANEFDRFLAAIEQAGARPHSIGLFSAHPTGSAHAGTETAVSAAAGTGEVHGARNLFIGDGSLLPTAPGVNPMISIMAVARGTAETIAGRLRSTRAG
ncbi:MAG TPA: GMC family oxidoreductase [Thermoplasmata archaeon]|nr:GMC family oxidoreductase [Thermoplasmata archaeon]